MTNTTKTEALRLADAIDPGNEGSKIVLTIDVAHAAAELRRLDAIEQARQALATTEQAAPAVPQGEPVATVVDNFQYPGVSNELDTSLPIGTKVYATPAAPSQPAVPEIDYPELIRAAYATDKKWAQGTNGCSAFARGAEWFRDQVIAALREKQSAPRE